jgi:hypothetical protein
MRVLILGGRAPVALDHARRFASAGWTTLVADSMPARLSSWSRHVSKAVRLPPPRTALADFTASLARIIERECIDVLLPTCEEVFFVSRVRARLPTACNVFTAPFELLRELHSKWHFLALAQDCGASVPRAALVDGLEAAREWAGTRPVVLKPEFSRFGVHVRLFPLGMPATTSALPSLGRWVVQEFLAGSEICSYSIAVAGKLRAHVAYRPSYRLNGSSSFYFDPVKMPAIERFVTAFVARIGFTGQISFDWIDDGNGKPTVLECNPRAISGLHLFDVDAALPAVITGADVCVMPDMPPARMIAAAMLGVGMPAAVRGSRFAQWRADWNRATDVLSAPGDARPMLGALADMTSLLPKALRARSTLRAAATRDIEWDGEELFDT